MTKEALLELKKKIALLSEQERKERYIYLRGLATGEIQGPPTGYPDQDMKWLRHYSEEAILSNVPKMTMYEFMYNNNKNHLNEIAIKYYGKNITYRELFENIDKVARSLVANGIKYGDVVGICAPTTPEAVYLFYAINKIGAISSLIDVRKSTEEIKQCLNITKTKMLFIYDGQLERISSIVNDTGVKDVISLSPTESLEKYKQVLASPQQFFQNLKKRKECNRNYYFYDEFIKFGEKIRDFATPKYKEETASFIVCTSGSTGIPKAVSLTNDTANTRVHQYMNNGMIYKRGDTYLDIIPIFLAFGSIVGIHLPLSMGLSDELIPAFDSKKIYELMKQKKPEHMTLTPVSYIELINSKRFNHLNLRNVSTWGCGGDGMNASEEIIINHALKGQGSLQNVNNGYGGTEIGAPFCTQKDGVTVPGSVGIPLPGNNVIIIDHVTGERLRANEIGDICMIVSSPMIEYLDNEELTSQTRLDLGNGQYAIMLRDAGFVDEDGNLFIKGRFEDAIYSDNDIIWPVDIENLIYSMGMSNICAVAPSHGTDVDCNMYVCLANDINKQLFEDMLENVLKINHCNSLSYRVNFIKDMPLTSSGKIDRKMLKEMSAELPKTHQK